MLGASWQRSCAGDVARLPTADRVCGAVGQLCLGAPFSAEAATCNEAITRLNTHLRSLRDVPEITQLRVCVTRALLHAHPATPSVQGSDQGISCYEHIPRQTHNERPDRLSRRIQTAPPDLQRAAPKAKERSWAKRFNPRVNCERHTLLSELSSSKKGYTAKLGCARSEARRHGLFLHLQAGESIGARAGAAGPLCRQQQ